MSRLTKMVTAVATGLLLVASSSAFADEQDKRKTQQDPRERTQNREARQRQTDRSRIGRLDRKTPADTVRASQLIGMNIQNAEGKSVGEIHDLVLDAETMEVRYAAVSYGGFLNLGDKLFAVPIEAIEARQNPEDREEQILVMNVTEQQLEGAQGFNENSWPDFADAEFTQSLDKRYGIDRAEENRRRAAFRKDRDQTEPDDRDRLNRRQPNQRDRNQPIERNRQQPNERNPQQPN